MIFSKETLGTAGNLIRTLCCLSESARREGLLALDEKLSDLTGSKYESFMQEILMLIVDGFEFSDIEFVGKNLITNSEFSSEEDKILYEIVLTGCLSIQQGDNPRMLVFKCASYLGIDNRGDLLKELLND